VSSDADILIRVSGRVGHVTLNRPKALNALTYDMAIALENALDDWATDDTVAMILIDAVGEKAFCAGGDIQALYESGNAGDFGFGRRFWADEYRLNAKIADYPKPYVAIMQGFVMGGGVGLSAHGSHRVVTESTMVAMPECSIGLVPDVGGSYILGHAPGYCGEYLGLTGTRLNAADAIYAGFADSYVPLDRIESLKAALLETGDSNVIADFSAPAPEGRLASLQTEIDAVFAADTALGCRQALAENNSDWAQKTLKAFDAGSPISLACAFEMIRAARQDSTVKTALQREYRFVFRCMEHGDFLEGIRAAVIDKDRNPKFAKPDISAVSAANVAAMLAEPPNGDINI